jgi:hypothetical protein
MKSDKIQVYKKKSITNLVILGVVIIALIVASVYYFIPKTEMAENLVVRPGVIVDLEESQQQFLLIKQQLLQNEDFLALEKFAPWPLNLVDLSFGNTKPFMHNVVEEPVETEEPEAQE